MIERDEDGFYIASSQNYPAATPRQEASMSLMSRIKEAAELYLEATGVKPPKANSLEYKSLRSSPVSLKPISADKLISILAKAGFARADRKRWG